VSGEEEWQGVLDRLAAVIDLEESAKEAGALQRRREIRSASDLLRMIFAYVVCDWSLRLVGAWCEVSGVGSLSAVAVRKRLRGSRKWLGTLLGMSLQASLLRLRQQPGVRVRLMDATCVSEPGSTGTDWRIHLSLDLGNLCVDGVDVTDYRGGETFARCPIQPGEIRVGDRGYAFANSLEPVLASGGELVGRINWQSLPLEDATGQPVDLINCLYQLTEPTGEWAVYLHTPQARFPLRLIVAALPQEQADRARQRVRKIYRKKGKTPDKRTLFAAGYVMLVTNLPAFSWLPSEVVELYRLRWQIELFFKRMKSILHLDHLRAFDPDLAQVYLLGKLLAALLTDQCIRQVRLSCPAWFTSQQRPVSPWRLTALFFDWLRQTVRGQITLAMILEALPHLTRFLCDPPRKRPSQFIQASILLAGLSGG
jgi:hypothetical protein